MKDETYTGSEIAIIGMACRFPGASTPEEFWQNLRDGKESLTELTDEELRAAGVPSEELSDPAYVRRASVVDGIEDFDASFFGYAPLEATIMDPQHRLFLECAWEVFERAGYDPKAAPQPTGVFTGAKTNTYLFNVVAQRGRFPSLDNFQIALGNDLMAMATRVSYKLDLRGPSYALHTACSTSLVAVHLACQSLLLEECNMAVAGGAAINVPQRKGYLYQTGGILSPDGSCRTFDESAAGSNFGNGAGAVLLKRLDDALADGDRIHAVIRGSATNNDGAAKASFTAPGVEGQTAVLLEAMAVAGIEAEEVSYIEAHGTATDLGDSIEMLALTEAFRASTKETGFCAIGSAKTNIGHLETAAGIAGLIKTASALEAGELPPSLHFEQPNPKIDFASSPFVVNAELRPWPEPAEGGRRIAGLSSFGIGSTNAHMILEEPPAPAAGDPERPWQLLLLSARTETALAQAAENLGRHLDENRDLVLADVAYTLHVGRRDFEQRRALVCRDLDEAVAMLTDGTNANSELVGQDHHATVGAAGRRVSFLFPGLGEHYVDMGLGLYQREPVFRAAVDRAAEHLAPQLGVDLREILYPRGTDAAESTGGLDLKAMLGRGTSPRDPASEKLDRTVFAQPATFAIELALAELMRSRGIEPEAAIGYSLGEYVCACLSGALTVKDALTLVTRRAQLIDALPGGAMLAVTLDENELVPRLQEHGLSLAAVNGATGCVAAGPEEQVKALEAALDADGVVYRRLTTTHAFHSTMLEPAKEELTELVRGFTLRRPEIPWVSNVTGTWITDEQATDPAYWAQHMCAPVRFADGLHTLLTHGGERALLEVGPGQSLASFARLHADCGKERPIVATMRSRHDHTPDAATLLGAFGHLWLGGVALDTAKCWEGERRRRVTLPTYPFERQRHWIDPDEATLARTAGREVPTTESAGAPTKIADLEEWLYHRSWQTLPWPGDTKTSGSGLCLILADDLGVAEALAPKVGAGQTAYAVPGENFAALGEGRFTVRPGQAEDYEELLKRLGGGPRLARVIHLWNLGAGQALDGEEGFRAAQETGFYSLISLVQAISRRRIGGSLEIDVVTHGVQDVDGDEELFPERSTLLGAAAVIPQEHPQILCRVIDVDLPVNDSDRAVDVARIADRLASELRSANGEPVVVHRGDERRVRTFEKAAMPPEESAFSFRDEGVYLITGGLGGIGLALAGYLAREHRAKLVLTRRSPLPPRSEWPAILDDGTADERTRRALSQINALESAGAEVLAAAADVTDEAAMREVIAEARQRFGTIHGAIHAAGVLAEDSFKTVALTGREECELHFAPKVYGLYVLERVLEGIELDFCTLYSSLSAILGGLGYVGYATANLFMDFFTARHNRRVQESGGVPWQSVDWDSWHYEEDEDARGGLGTTLSELAMTPSEGVETLRRLLAVAEPSYLVISTGELQPRLDQWVAMRTLRAVEEEAPGATRARRKSPGAMAGEELEQEVAGIWQRVLGVEVGREDNFFDVGGNSLLGMQVVAELSRDLGVEVEPVVLFESPTVAAMAHYLSPEAETETAPKQRMRRRSDNSEIAIIGLDGRFPGAGSIEELWRNLRSGRETISFFSDDELRAAGVDEKTLADPQYVKVRPILEDIECFDAPFFGYTPREAEIMDPQHRVFLESAWRAFEDAGYDIERYDGPVGVYAGASISSYMANIYSNPELVESVGTFQTLIGNEKDSLTTKVSYKMNLRGPSLAVQTFCSTSLVAVHLACQALINGECDMSLAGGVSIIVPQVSGYRFEQGGIGSKDGHIRAFDAKGSGIVFGNGLGCVVLKRLEDAVADGDPIRAVIKGTAINNDGSGKAGYSATSVEGQAEVVSAALEVAGVDPETVGYMEAHGTGTPLGDPIEMAAINKAFRAHTQSRKFCPIGSVKTNFGHLDRAAGISGLTKAILALEHGEIPPSLNFDEPNPAIDFEDNSFYVSTELLPWPKGATPRRAGVNSLGLGGTNAHAVLEEAPEQAPSSAGKEWQLLLLSAQSDEALERGTDQLAAHLETHSEQPLADVAYTLQVGRKAMSQRRFVVAKSHAEASTALAERLPQQVFSGTRQQKPRVVFFFPGLGGQYVGMARGLYEAESVFRETFDRVADLIRDELGSDLREVLFSAPDEKNEPKASESAGEKAVDKPKLDLRRMLGRGDTPAGEGPLAATAIAQPALFAVEVALVQLVRSWGIEPQAMVGYSLGEYVAATVGGMMSLEDAALLVTRRARRIEQLEAGAMLAVPLAEEAVLPRLGEALSLAATNGPEQSVVAGPPDAVAAFAEELAAEGVVSRRLETTHAFHSRGMEEIYDPIVEELSGIELHAPKIPWLSNVTGDWIRDNEAADPTYWARHMCQPVRFSESIEVLAGQRGSLPWKDGEMVLLELGPGQTLGSLALQHPAMASIKRPPVIAALRHSYESQPDLAHVYEALGKLWVHGVEVDWPALSTGERRLRMRLPTYSFDRRSYWVDSRAHGYTGVARMAATATAASAEGGLVYLPSWQRRRAPRPLSPAQLGGALDSELKHWLLFVDDNDGGVSAALAKGLTDAGRQVTRVTPGPEYAALGEGLFALRPGNESDAAGLVTALGGTPPDAVVHLWDLAATADEEPSEARNRGLGMLLALVRSLRGAGSPALALWTVSAAACEVSGDENLLPAAATVLAATRVLPREQPEITCRAIDVIPPKNGSAAVLADRLLVEIASAPPEQLTAYRGGYRWIPALEPAAMDDAPPELSTGGAYIVTGGLNSRGFAFATYLAQHTKDARIALIDPPGAADDDRRKRRLASLSKDTAEILELTADPADSDAFAAAAKEAAERFGMLNGIVHAAEPADIAASYATIAEAPADVGDALLTALGQGAHTLEKALNKSLDPSGFALLVSSPASSLGGLGLVHDAAAGLYLDAFAARAAAEGGRLPWASVSWDFFLDDASDEVLSSGLAQTSSSERTAALQAAALGALFRSLPATQLLATPRSLDDAWDHVRETVEKPAATETGGLYPRPQLAVDYVAPRTETEKRVVEVWATMLGLSEVGLHDGFLELGGDSLLAARLVAKMREIFDLELPVRLFFEASTVELLAIEVDKLLAQNAEEEEEAMTDLLAMLDGLSEEEVEAELARRAEQIN